MAYVQVRNLSPAAHEALRKRAAGHHRSVEAELRAILEELLLPADRVRVGSALAAGAGGLKLTDEEAAVFDRDQTPPRGADL